MQTTKHTCGGPHFGRLTSGCPRCDELAGGATAIQQPWRRTVELERERFRADPRAALDDAKRTGTVCTFGDW